MTTGTAGRTKAVADSLVDRGDHLLEHAGLPWCSFRTARHAHDIDAQATVTGSIFLSGAVAAPSHPLPARDTR